MRPPPEKMNVWIDFNGHYEKHECDIMLKDGTIIECCWPNAGAFSRMKKNKGDSVIIEANKINKIMYKDYFKKIFKQT